MLLSKRKTVVPWRGLKAQAPLPWTSTQRQSVAHTLEDNDL